MAVFRTCLSLGLATVLVLGVVKLYPVALIAGAVLLPVLVVLYMVDINVFEEQSLPVIAKTTIAINSPALLFVGCRASRP